MIDLLKEYDNQANPVKHLPRRLVKSFEEHLQSEGINETEYYDAIDAYVDAEGYCIGTRRVYKNRLRRFLDGIKKK